MNSLKSLSVFLWVGLIAWPAYATTTVTVDDNVQAAAPVTTTVVTPAAVTQAVPVEDFEGRIVEINYSQNLIIVRDTNGADRQVVVTPETINSYRVGDYVLVHPTATVTLITVDENPKEFEGEIIRVDLSEGQIVVQDTTGRERRVQLKQGMIATYKVGDYVRVRLMADLKEAKTIETLREVRNLEGRIVNVDASRNQIVVRDNDGKDSAVLLRQGQIHHYRAGDQVRIYLLPNREQVQVIRLIR